MHHAITIGGLLSTVCALLGLCLLGFGVLAVFAGGMSDAPEDGNSFASGGCAAAVIGAAMIALGIWGLS